MKSSRPLLRGLVALLAAAPLSAQFDYTLGMDLEERVWRVEGSFENPDGSAFEYWFPRWTPGAYHVADFGQFASGFWATDGEGKEIAFERVDANHVRVEADGARQIRIGYEGVSISDGIVTHGNVLDVESNRIRDDYAYVTPVSLFGFVPARAGEEIRLRVDLPHGWKTATALTQDASGVYRAPSFARFEDSPLFFAPDLVTVETEAGGKPLVVSVLGLGAEGTAKVVDDCRRISEAGIKVMGGAPYDRYHYLIGFVPEGQGSGLEHSFSTLILMPRGAAPETARGLIAHEFFHLWCAERVHVEGIRNADFTEPFVTGTIWVNESMTEYMSQHLLFHAGMLDLEGLFRAIGPNRGLEQMAAGLSPSVEVSRAAVGWESMGDLMRFATKMYAHGSRLIFALDLEMRRLSDGERGIVDFLRHVMAEYDAKGLGFPEDGVVDILEEVAGGELDSFYEAFIAGSGNPDFERYLDVIGASLDGDTIRLLESPTPQQVRALEDYLGG